MKTKILKVESDGTKETGILDEITTVSKMMHKNEMNISRRETRSVCLVLHHNLVLGTTDFVTKSLETSKSVCIV